MAAIGRDGLKDATAGLVGSVILVGNIVSFAALMFPGDLSAGIPTAIWSMLIGSCIGGIWIALFTSLRPLSTGIDGATGTVLVLLSASVGHSIVAAGGNARDAITSVMLIFTAAVSWRTGGPGMCLPAVCAWGSHHLCTVRPRRVRRSRK